MIARSEPSRNTSSAGVGWMKWKHCSPVAGVRTSTSNDNVSQARNTGRLVHSDKRKELDDDDNNPDNKNTSNNTSTNTNTDRASKRITTNTATTDNDSNPTNNNYMEHSFVSDPDDHASTSMSRSINSELPDASVKPKSKEGEFVRKETQQVLVLRTLVVVMLFVAGIAVSLVFFAVATDAENDAFLKNFQSAAREVTEKFLEIPTLKIGAVAAYTVAEVAHGLDHGRIWPFVTLSSYPERAHSTLEHSLALQIGKAPIVAVDQRNEWELYSGNTTLWFDEGIQYQIDEGTMHLAAPKTIPVTPGNSLNLTSGIGNHIFEFGFGEDDLAYTSPDRDIYVPLHQVSPITRIGELNRDLLRHSNGARACVTETAVVFDRLFGAPPGARSSSNPMTAKIASLLSFATNTDATFQGDTISDVYVPLFNTFSMERRVVGLVRVTIQWSRYFQNILAEETRGVIVVLEDDCGEPYTYQIDGKGVNLLGWGDLHDPAYENLGVHASLTQVESIQDGTEIGMDVYKGECPISIHIYPSSSMKATFESDRPLMMTISVAAVFLFTILMFIAYDRLVERRQRLIMLKAQSTNAIVSSLFPKTVRERLMETVDNHPKQAILFPGQDNRQKTKTASDPYQEDSPIAELFPHATVLFADIAGFTAWTSMREPSQVFHLLQSVYKEFDLIADTRKVFKVETIGDTYVAVAGLPDPQPDHFIIMARFAQDCMKKMDIVVERLEPILGPGTGDLKMRFGLNSGPVTGGVLAGSRARFQLFGDTVNTAARMESTGAVSKIQCSQTTAELLISAGKGHWVTPREDAVEAKGKGVLKTFWINPSTREVANDAASEAGDKGKSGDSIINVDQGKRLQHLVPVVVKAHKEKRHVDWMTEILLDYSKNMVAKDTVTRVRQSSAVKPDQLVPREGESRPIDELVKIIELAPYNESIIDVTIERPEVSVPDEIKASMRAFVAMIASTYRNNPFHNFEHACHVTMSVVKLLKRVVGPKGSWSKLEQWKQGLIDEKDVISYMPDYTHGIHGDPLALFAIVFSALIHDADHRGVSNAQLIQEDQGLAKYFKNQSVAEQNSVDVAWKLLLNEQFNNLRNFLFASGDNLRRFRQIVVNVVLATDIFDKELNALRKERWNNAFGVKGVGGQAKQQDSMMRGSELNGLRVTIVIEHIIQASDVSHTMQHWNIYQKWNKLLFQEMLIAYREGRMAADPATFWYKGEIGFFDHYVIPLAKKLEDCKVFGVASDECLNYAVRNREEWVARGEGLVAGMVNEFQHLRLDPIKDLVVEGTVPLQPVVMEADTSNTTTTNSVDVNI